LLATQTVVEQAKGILMATYRCSPDEALGILRRASQVGNVEVHVLAERLVERAASSRPPRAGAKSRSKWCTRPRLSVIR
jgi:AmiR/NasT family two-component response regulator